jgi:hypothetical protein
MKTVGELRALIQGAGGTLNIGKIAFRLSEGDVDIHVNDELVQWYSEELDNEALLNDDDIYSVMDSVMNRAEYLRKVEAELKRANEEVDDLKRSQGENSLAVGKLAAYETLFVGKNITISQPQ